MNIKYDKDLIPRAKELRHNMTKQEKRLWYDFFTKYPIRFKKQKVIGSFIADFYCDEANLIVEIDGNQHFQEEDLQYDEEGTAYFNTLGIKVIRVSNHDVNTNFDGVCLYIDKNICEILGRNVHLEEGSGARSFF